ncbi:hypothetical protein ACHAW6_002045 [Cyclotella cf. meneghiniana]
MCIHLALWQYAMRSTLNLYNTAPILPDRTNTANEKHQ